jgi:DNA repair exonuclease SbcCD nuclease subunit
MRRLLGQKMKILHTSDLHLSEKSGETLRALKVVLEIATREKVDALTLGGDIFHSPKDADALRNQIRNIFDDLPFKIVAIPGNHDGTIFSKDFDFGFDVSVKEPFREFWFDDVCIVAVPFTDSSPDEILPTLKTAASKSRIRILLLHCTLDLGFDMAEYGDESTKKYFPVTRAELSELGYDYVLAGHFHKNCEVTKLKSGSEFIYPGSPVSHSWKETGRRHIVVIDTEKRKTKKIVLPTYYCDILTLDVLPGSESSTIEELRAWHAEREHDSCKLEVTIRGVIRRKEGEFRKSLQNVAPSAQLNFECKDVRAVFQHPLYKRFQKKVKAEVSELECETVTDILIEVMSGLIAGGDLES